MEPQDIGVTGVVNLMMAVEFSGAALDRQMRKIYMMPSMVKSAQTLAFPWPVFST